MQGVSSNRVQSVIPPIIKNCLDGSPGEYSLVSHSGTQTLEETATMLGMPREKLIRSVIISSGLQQYMAILPLSHALDFNSLKKRLGDDVRVASSEEKSSHTGKLEGNMVPPLSSVVALPVIIDNSIRQMTKVCFEAGSHHDVVIMDTKDFIRMQQPGVEFADIAFSIRNAVESGDVIPDSVSISTIRDRIETFRQVPDIPAICAELLRLRNRPDASVDELEAVIESDLQLASQTLRYARSSLFGYRGKVYTLKDAIARVLGFDVVLNLAIGLSIARAFRIPEHGPLGLYAHWHHSIATAELSRRLAQLMPTTRRPSPGIVYLSGLLHNFGFLLLGNLFQPEFYLLNKLASANPGVPVRDLEMKLFGMGQVREAVILGHNHIGALLMEAWNMPDPVSTIVRKHHVSHYTGKHDRIVNLVQLSNKLLSRIGIGDEGESPLPVELLRSLDLDPGEVESMMDDFIRTTLHEVPIAVKIITS